MNKKWKRFFLEILFDRLMYHKVLLGFERQSVRDALEKGNSQFWSFVATSQAGPTRGETAERA